MPVFDQGYQHWNGALSSHLWRWLAITRHGIRTILSNRLVRFLLLLAWLPALALATVLAIWGLLEQQLESIVLFLQRILPQPIVEQPQSYRSAMWTIAYSFYFQVELYVLFCMMLIVGPRLISRDIRFNALPLYLSRPLRRTDYFIGKIGVIGFFIGAIVVAPTFFAYILGVCFSLDLTVLSDTHHLLWGSLIYGVIIILSVGTLMLAMSSLSRNSIYVGLMWVGFWLVSSIVSTTLMVIHMESSRRANIRQEMQLFIENNPPPKGIRIHRGFHFSQDVQHDLTREERHDQNRWISEWSYAHNMAHAKAIENMHEDKHSDWRPICSYVANLNRMGDVCLSVDAAWVTFGRAVPAQFRGGRRPSQKVDPDNERFLADQMVPQYPWLWTAAVLAALMSISTWILTLRVKSLDRLK